MNRRPARAFFPAIKRVRIPSLWLLLLGVSFALGANNNIQPLSDRNYYMRIGILKAVMRLAIKPVGSYQAMNPGGAALGVLKNGGLYYVEIVKGRPGGRVFRLVVRELGPHQDASAVMLAKTAGEAYHLPSKAIRMPPKDAKDEEKLLVTVGEFDSMDSALAYRDAHKSEVIRYVFEEKAVGREGRVILRDEQGRMIASDPSLLRLAPADPINSSMHLTRLEEAGKCKSSDLEKGRHYRGLLDLAINEEGTLTAVNTVWLEYYLYGVVAAEIGDSTDIEALRAQAVAARSEALATIEYGISSNNPLFDFDDTTKIQAYSGKGEENPLIRQAVDSTRGEILVADGKPIRANYSDCCGGVMCTSKDVWDGDELDYFRRKPDRLTKTPLPDLSSPGVAERWMKQETDSFCNPNQPGYPEYAKKHFRWEKNLSVSELSKAASDYGTGTVKDVIIDKRSPGGRVRTLLLIGENKSARLTREMEIRSVLGDIMSVFIYIEKNRDSKGKLSSITIHGAGWGHGVGLCQMGAMMMAKKNYTYRQILGHYFTDVKIRKLY